MFNRISHAFYFIFIFQVKFSTQVFSLLCSFLAAFVSLLAGFFAYRCKLDATSGGNKLGFCLVNEKTKEKKRKLLH